MSLVNIYLVQWKTGGHKYPAENNDYVAAAAGTGAVALGASIQAQNNDGRAVTVTSVQTIYTAVLQ